MKLPKSKTDKIKYNIDALYAFLLINVRGGSNKHEICANLVRSQSQSLTSFADPGNFHLVSSSGTNGQNIGTKAFLFLSLDTPAPASITKTVLRNVTNNNKNIKLINTQRQLFQHFQLIEYLYKKI